MFGNANPSSSTLNSPIVGIDPVISTATYSNHITRLPFIVSAYPPQQYYFVSSQGSDSNPGTKTRPWRTIQKAANTVVAGDTVIIGAGSYGENVTISRSGTTAAPIVFLGQISPFIVESNPTNTACLDARNSCILGVISITGNNIVFNNLEISGPPANPGDIAGITIRGNYDEVSNNFIHNTWQEGISLTSSSNNNHVRNNNIMYGVVSGIYFDGQNHLIEGNTITHSVTRPPDRILYSTLTDIDGIRFFGSGSVVRSNTIKDIYLDESPEIDAPHPDCFQTWGSANNITFERNYCELENATTYANPMVKFFMISRSTTAVTVSNLKIINNIFVSKSMSTLWTPIHIGHDACSSSYPLQNFLIANNTFIHTGNVVAGTAILIRCADSVDIRNNIFYNFGDPSHSYIYQDMNNNSNLTISNNSVYNTTGIPPQGGAYPGDEIASTWMKNPLFQNVSGGNYHLESNSPLKDRGYDLINIVTNDFDGITRPQGAGYDIGALELLAP